jgi:hypothetical protein
VVVVRVIVVTMIVMGCRRVGVAMIMIVVMLDGVPAGVAGMRAKQRDQAGQDGAQQRQKNDCQNHD